MATGIDMLINAVLKATGFDRSQLDDGLVKGKAMIDDFEKRLATVETNIGELLAIARRNDNAADDRGGGVDDGQ